MVLLSLIALTSRECCRQGSAESKNRTIFKLRRFATTEDNQKNVLEALKEIPKYKCSQYSVCPTSAVKPHCSSGRYILEAQFCKRENRGRTPQVSQWADTPEHETFVFCAWNSGSYPCPCNLGEQGLSPSSTPRLFSAGDNVPLGRSSTSVKH